MSVVLLCVLRGLLCGEKEKVSAKVSTEVSYKNRSVRDVICFEIFISVMHSSFI